FYAAAVVLVRAGLAGSESWPRGALATAIPCRAAARLPTAASTPQEAGPRAPATQVGPQRTPGSPLASRLRPDRRAVPLLRIREPAEILETARKRWCHRTALPALR